jgi:Peptidase A4 family
MTTRLALPAVLLTLLVPSAALAGPPRHAPRHTFGRSTSTNWSGYDVTGSRALHVIGTWTQPSASCGAGENSWSSPWVGIDGDTSNTVEQIGTDTDCSGGAPLYYAWYEMYPKSLVQIPMTVTPGHSYTGEVTTSGSGSFTLKLTDNSTNPKAVFQTIQSSKRARLASIEWIMEGPSSGTLTNFGSVSFSGASGTVNGQTTSLGLFANPVADPITMVTSQGATRALPGPIGRDNASFGVSWKGA